MFKLHKLVYGCFFFYRNIIYDVYEYRKIPLIGSATVNSEPIGSSLGGLAEVTLSL